MWRTGPSGASSRSRATSPPWRSSRRISCFVPVSGAGCGGWRRGRVERGRALVGWGGGWGEWHELCPDSPWRARASVVRGRGGGRSGGGGEWHELCPDSPCCARALVVRGRGDGPSGANSNRYVPSNSFARIVAAWAEPSGSAGSTSTHRIQQVSKPWIIRFQSRPDARVRLFCLPHAGVGASAYRTWHTGLGPEVEVCAVQPPGRESRFREPPYRRLVDLADAVAAAIAPETDGPYALFGRSMGAWVAFEVARRLDGRRAGPACLIVSGRRSPQSEAEAPPIHQ